MTTQIKSAQVHAVGKKDPARRSLFSKGDMLIVLLAAVGGWSAQDYLQNQTSLYDRAHTSTSEVSQKAQVIAKVRYHGGLEISGQEAEKNSAVWQPEADAPSSAYQLVLNIPGEKDNAVVAVSKDTFEKFCQKPAFSYKRGHDKNQSGDYCGGVVNGQGLEKVGDIDDVTVSFTKNKNTGKIQITQFESSEKNTPGIMDRILLKRSSESALETARKNTYPDNTTPRG